MSKKVKAIDFCEKYIEKEKRLASARIYNDKIRCIIASKVVFKYECQTKSDTYCDDKTIGCFMIKEDFAKRLKLIHSSILKNGQKSTLNCNFMSEQILKAQ